MRNEATETLLELRDLRTHFFREGEVARAVDGVSLRLSAGETLGLVGESGCGKSVTALSILRLVPDPPGRIVGGEVLFRGQNLLALSEERMRQVRGNDIAMVFQEPMTALNPVFTVGSQIAEAVQLHQSAGPGEARERVIEVLERVGLPAAHKRIDHYPHQLSGGMRQRVLIAMAIACRPQLLIADEPTTALDVTIQAQILNLIRRLQEDDGTGVLLITHDLGVVAQMAQRVAVMYGGKVVESAPVNALFERPRHPYTVGLLRSLPERAAPGERLAPIRGSVPNAFAYPSGCRFRTRCPVATARCAEMEPVLAVAPGADVTHGVACHHPMDGREVRSG